MLLTLQYVIYFHLLSVWFFVEQKDPICSPSRTQQPRCRLKSAAFLLLCRRGKCTHLQRSVRLRQLSKIYKKKMYKKTEEATDNLYTWELYLLREKKARWIKQGISNRLKFRMFQSFDGSHNRVHKEYSYTQTNSVNSWLFFTCQSFLAWDWRM